MNVCSNVARDFLALIDKHFKAGNPLKNIMNRSCIKVSYRCLPNIGARIAGHNKKILRKAEEKKAEAVKTGVKPCNCQKSKVAECPTPGACNTDGVVYKATVSSSDGRKEYYVGLAKNFKLRFAGHKATLKTKPDSLKTTLSTHFWKEKEEGKDPEVTWELLDTGLEDYNPTSGRCNLCIREKYFILFEPEKSTLNSRQELFGFCRHEDARLLEKPPDKNGK